METSISDTVAGEEGGGGRLKVAKLKTSVSLNMERTVGFRDSANSLSLMLRRPSAIVEEQMEVGGLAIL